MIYNFLHVSLHKKLKIFDPPRRKMVSKICVYTQPIHPDIKPEIETSPYLSTTFGNNIPEYMEENHYYVEKIPCTKEMLEFPVARDLHDFLSVKSPISSFVKTLPEEIQSTFKKGTFVMTYYGIEMEYTHELKLVQYVTEDDNGNKRIDPFRAYLVAHPEFTKEEKCVLAEKYCNCLYHRYQRMIPFQWIRPWFPQLFNLWISLFFIHYCTVCCGCIEYGRNDGKRKVDLMKNHFIPLCVRKLKHATSIPFRELMNM